jgi:putative glutathione S-transferase
MDHIKNHYYQSHATVNPTGIVPKGPVLDFAAPHDRDRLGGPGGLAAVAEAV